MTKRKTKAQREAEQRAALWREIHAIYSGACGHEFAEGDTDEGMEASEWLTLETAERALPVLKERYRGDPVDMDKPGGRCLRDWLFELHNLGKFETVSSARDFLWDVGVRP